MASRHVVILGGGVSGLAVAETCAKRGHRVTLIERHGPTRSGCSFGNAGMVVPSHFVPMAAPGMVALGLKWMWNPESPFYIKPRLDPDLTRWGMLFLKSSTREHVARCAPLLRDLHLAARAAYQAFAAEGEEIGLASEGLLMLCKTPHALAEETAMAERAADLGVPARVLDAAGAASLDPGITMAVAGAVHYPLDCHLSPERYLAALQRRATTAGVEFLWQTEVREFAREGRSLRAALTNAGEVTGDAFVLCGGVWSERLMRRLGARLPMQAGKGYSVTLPDPVERPRLCSILTEARVAVTPMGGALRFGGTMEMAGLNEGITRRRVDGILRAAGEYFPRFRRDHFDGIEPWQGLRPCPPDGMPFLGRTGAADNLLVATGHAMMGLSLAPVTGAVIARLVSGEEPGFDLTLLHPDRFA